MTRRLVLLSCCVLQLAACITAPAPVEEQSAIRRTVRAAPLPPGYYQVRRGDTLYSIAFQYGYSFDELARWNAISTPYVIYIGQRLRVMSPGRDRPSTIRVLPAEAAAAEIPAAASPAQAERPAAETTSSGVVPSHDKVPAGPLRWSWPSQGRLLHAFGPSQTGGKGIDIAGRLGQDVTAAANGWVVYSGSGLRGYGQLIIVKHDKSLLSAYGNNGKLLVKEGDAVRGGEVIAVMGENGDYGPMLHFEIRRDGKPVNPLDYLPRQ